MVIDFLEFHGFRAFNETERGSHITFYNKEKDILCEICRPHKKGIIPPGTMKSTADNSKIKKEEWLKYKEHPRKYMKEFEERMLSDPSIIIWL